MKKLLLVLIVLNFFSCAKKEILLTSPVINTTEVSFSNDSTVTTGGNISSDGNSPITSRGIVWDLSPNPTIILNTKTNDGSGIGSFNSTITNLKPATKYFFRAFATNKIGTSYGNELTYTTKSALPKVSTSNVLQITYQSALFGGVTISDGGAQITEKGFVWSANPSPTTSLKTKTISQINNTNFEFKIDTLVPDKTYYVRAYAINANGTSYGNEVIFKTNKVVIGDKYGGGIVAYLLQSGDPNYDVNVQHGIISAIEDQSQKVQWNSLIDRYDFNLTGANGTKIGTGITNTDKILSFYNSPTSTFAAIVARNYNAGGFKDWSLPSKDELYKLYLNREKIGGFSTDTLDLFSDWYWTSSEINAAYAEALNFMTGNFDGIGGYKGPGGTPYKLRAIRYF
jgi:hypothetical protein